MLNHDGGNDVQGGTAPRNPMRRALLGLVPALALAAPRRASAQDFPTRPVTIIVPTGPGGAADTIARLLGARLSEAWRRPVMVENRAGAGGNIGTRAVARAAPDGHTLLIYTPNVTVNAFLYRELGYDPDTELTPITQLASSPLVLITGARGAATTQELLLIARRRPGQLSWASAVVGSPNHLAGELFRQRAGIEVTNVAYKGIQEGVLDIIGGRVDFGFGTTAASLPLVRAGQLRAVAITTAERSPLVLGVPTIAEAGLPGFDMTAWFGLWAPAGMPQPLVDRIRADMVATMAEPAVRDQLALLGFTPVGSEQDTFRRFIAAETAQFRNVIARAGIQPE